MSAKKSSIPSILENNAVLCTGDMAINLYNKGYYGIPESKGVSLNNFEALHLFEMGRIEIKYIDKIMNGPDLMLYFSEREPDFMIRYMVYKDLRNRGYVVNVGKGSAFFFRLYSREAKPKSGGAKYYIKPLQEGGSIKLRELETLIDLAKQSQKELIFGMLDVTGDVSYLKADEETPVNILK